MKKYLGILVTILLLSGCAPKPNLPKVNAHQVSKLNKMLNSLHVKKSEAKDLARKAVIHAEKLAHDYKLVRPPLFQNFLVNVGLRKKGLCWQFAYDMLSFVKKQHYKSFDYYIGGANIGNYWDEHNVLVVTCKGCSFDQGVLLDPWRDSGKLFFSKVEHDKDYKWRPRGGLR
ncbi:MAG: hypothetical protein R3331_00050 [Sulfurospirillaceae bacterium]|nr:hypothetical protein [Sulfurospirillaceae bacterium]